MVSTLMHKKIGDTLPFFFIALLKYKNLGLGIYNYYRKSMHKNTKA
jgi:hypothetical protein